MKAIINNLKRSLNAFVQDRRGQTITEYAILAGFLAVTSAVFLNGTGEDTKTIFEKMSTKLGNVAAADNSAYGGGSGADSAGDSGGESGSGGGGYGAGGSGGGNEGGGNEDNDRAGDDNDGGDRGDRNSRNNRGNGNNGNNRNNRNRG